MNNELQVFEHGNFGDTDHCKLEVVVVDGDVFFKATPSAKALGYSNPRDAIIRHCDQKGVVFLDTHSAGGMQQVKYISEGNLYRLIMRSNLRGAKSIATWVFDEVLPSIRKYGLYAVDELINDPDLAIQAFTALRDERAKNRELSEKIDKMAHKVEFYDAVTGSKNAIHIGKCAKSLDIKGVGRNKLFEILRKLNILMWNNVPYQKYIDMEYFRVIIQEYTAKGEVIATTRTLIYPRGMEYIRKRVLAYLDK